jgi:hypothetical protein
MLRRRLFLTQVSILSATSIPALVAVPVQAATIVVNNQGQFDAAVAVATQPGHNDTIDASGAGTIDPGSIPGIGRAVHRCRSAAGARRRAG